jgi:hypothetical protein
VKAKSSANVQTKGTDYMSDEAFADLKQALEDALAFELGKGQSLRVTRIESSSLPKAPVKIPRSKKTVAPHRGRAT